MALSKLTAGKGVDVCVDSVGGDAFDAIARVMAYNGRLLVVGFASGRIPSLPVNLALLKGYSVVGVYWNNFVIREPESNCANHSDLAALFGAGKLNPRVFRTYRLDQVAQALADVLDRRVSGKLVIIP